MKDPMKTGNIANVRRGFAPIFALALLLFEGLFVLWLFLDCPYYNKMVVKPPEEFTPGVELSYSAKLAALPGRSWVAKMLGGDGVLDVLKKPDRGSVFRVHATEETLQKKDIALVSGPVQIAPSMLARIAEVFSSPGSYEDNLKQGKMCIPHYAVRFRLEKESDVADIYLCYSCAEMYTVLNGELLRPVSFDPSQSNLISIAQELFPDDSAIQALKSYR